MKKCLTPAQGAAGIHTAENVVLMTSPFLKFGLLPKEL